MKDQMQRCSWADTDELNIAYHDFEWGLPVHDEHRLFEMLTLEGAQAGLSWLTILRKREGYRKAFAKFDPKRVAGFDQKKIDSLVLDASIVRHRGKIEATVNNARRILALWEDGRSLDEFVWSFVNGRPVLNHWSAMTDLPAKTTASADLSRALKKLGFRFVGDTTCYAFMQAAGLVNDHLVNCPARVRCQSAVD
jgi:DNA-3-methyladenine glycosylase I